MEPEIITDGSLPGDAHMTPSDAQSAVSTKSPDAGEVKTFTSSAEALSLSEINTYLGKNFKDKDTALKAINDTFSYVGKKKEDIAREFKPQEGQSSEELKRLREEMAYLRKERFYDKNQDLNTPEYRTLIDKLGNNPEDVVKMPEFKAVFDKVKGFDESQKLRTVLESNPRVSSSRDSLSKAREAQSQGNREAVERLATDAVLATMGLK